MTYESTSRRILIGLPHNEGRPLLNRVAKRRFLKKVSTWSQQPHDGCWGRIYDGNRCQPDNVADRFSGYAFRQKPLMPCCWQGFRGRVKYLWAVVTTFLGFQDRKLESTWHERATLEWVYLCERD